MIEYVYKYYYEKTNNIVMDKQKENLILDK